MSRARPRVLWLPYAQRGSLYPVVPVVEELLAQGAEVVLLGLPRLAALAASLGTGFRPYRAELDYDWSRAGAVDRYPLGQRLAVECAEVDEALAELRPDLVFADSFLAGGGLAAERHGVPWSCYVHYLFDESADVDAMYRIEWERTRPTELESYVDWWNGLRAGVGLPAEARGPAEAPWYRMSPHATYLLGHPVLRRGTRPLPGYVRRTSVPPWDEAGTTDLAAPSAPDSPRVLVSNSSAWQDDIAVVEATLAGLAAWAGQVVVTVAAEHELTGPVPANAVLTGYRPHSALLPTVDAVVGTAGYGTVTKALWHGLPLVLAPQGRDQHYVAEAAVAAGVAVTVPARPDPAAVAAAVQQVLVLDGPRRVAAALAGPQPGHPGPEDVAKELLALAGRRP